MTPVKGSFDPQGVSTHRLRNTSLDVLLLICWWFPEWPSTPFPSLRNSFAYLTVFTLSLLGHSRSEIPSILFKITPGFLPLPVLQGYPRVACLSMYYEPIFIVCAHTEMGSSVPSDPRPWFGTLLTILLLGWIQWCVYKLSLLILFSYQTKTLRRKIFALGDRGMDDVSPPGIWSVLCGCACLWFEMG